MPRLVMTSKISPLRASIAAPGAARVPPADPLQAGRSLALHGSAPHCVQLPVPATSSIVRPPPPGWLSSIATSMLDMQQRQHASTSGPGFSVPGPAPPPRSPLLDSAAAPDVNRQAAKRLKAALGQAVMGNSRDSAVPAGGASAAACQPSTLAPQCSAGVGSEDLSREQLQQQDAQEERPSSTPVYDEEPPPPCLLGAEAEETAVQFLGTGSAEPSKYR